jgi:NADH:ubiquinone oxidoreductase subunit 3 (subunit A)
VTSAVSVFKPGRRYWVLYGFLTLLIALSSLFWFLDPVPGWVRLLGAVIVVWWISILVGVARARVEVRESTVEVFSPAYRLTPSRGGAWLYAVLLLFVLGDVAALFFGPWPHTVQRIGLGLRIAWLGTYLLNLLRHLESGKRSIRYSEIEKAPWEDWWQPYRTSVRKQAIFMEVAADAQPFMFPPWLSAADRHEVAGRVTAHVKRFRATHSGETR